MIEAVADTTHLQRIYYDASHWNRMLQHAEREAMARSSDRWAVFPSVINAAELLNTPDLEVRRGFCDLMARLQDENHSILDHPATVLQAAAEGWCRGEPSFVVSESKPANEERGAGLPRTTGLKGRCLGSALPVS